MLKTHIVSINLSLLNEFVYENLIWALASVWIFLCNYVVHSIGFILTYIFRCQRKNEQVVFEQKKLNQNEDYEIDKFTEDLAELIFPNYEYFHIASEEGKEGETEYSVLEKIDSHIQQDDEKGKGEIDLFILKEKNYDLNEDGKKNEEETKGSDFRHSVCDEDHEDVKKIDEYETECSVFKDGKKSLEDFDEEKEETKGSILIDTSFIKSRSECQFVAQKDFVDLEDEPMLLSFSFLNNVSYNNAISSIENIAKKEFHVDQEEDEEEFVQESRKVICNSNDDSLTYEIIGSNNFCEEFECESLKDEEDLEETKKISCNSEEVLSHGFFECINEKEGSSYHEEYIYKDSFAKNEDSFEKTEETMHEEEFDEMEYDEEEDEDEYEWENDEVMEQIKLEIKNARQGGLATILEEGEEEYLSKVVEEKIKPLSIDEKMEYKDHIVEIQKVYKCYAQKMRKLDVLNYQAMHAIGLLQLKDPPKLFLIQKSTVQHGKPLMIRQNLWPGKAQIHTSDPMLKLVNELHRDLELVYVGQICLSWEILCWLHEKIKELKIYDSQWPRRYNLVAGEFQLFQVLIQRFLEDEPFQQGHRIQNYVKNRCVIRNLLQVPTIKDDSIKDKKIKWGEEDAIASERLAQIINESMQMFWEFVKADKEDGNEFRKVSHHKGNEGEDKEISDLLGDIRTQLHKKERKLKEKLKSGNCIVRKFRKQNDDQIRLDHEQLLAQVGLRLISRVINMTKLRKDHLIWCSEKLNQINFVDRKIQMESSFLLFPC
ncbi:myb protein X [Trifolium repens]|nr:myb protein X [Trifolium repens]